MKTASLFVALLVHSVGFAFSAPIAKLVSIEGDVSIVRNGQIVKAQALVEGFFLENYDSVTTGAQSFVEIALLPTTGVRSTVKLSAQTSLFFEASSLKKEQNAVVELVAGSIAVRCEPLTGKNALTIKTDFAEIATRGGAVRVVSSLRGDLLVSASGGQAECRIDTRSLFAEPGTIVEALADEKKLRSRPVATATVEAYETKWISDRAAALKSEALRTVEVLSLTYQMRYSDAQRAFERLYREAGKTIELWKKQDAEATVSESKAISAEKSIVKGALVTLRNALSDLERFAHRLKAIRTSASQSAGYETFEISRGYKVKDFYAQLEKDEPNWTNWARTARTLYKSFSDRNEGSFPAFLPFADVTKESDFFH